MAWEFGQLLEREGYELGRVINIDQPVHSEIQKCRTWKRASNWLVRLKYPRTSLQDFLHTQKVNRVRTAGPESKDRLAKQIHLARVDEFYRAIARDYVPSANSIEMTLIRGELFQAKFELPKDYGWSKIAKSLHTVCIAGSHSTLFQKRFINGLKRAFVEAYQSVD